MAILSRVLESIVIRGLREIKMICLGRDDVRTANVIGPFGDDSNIPAGYKAIYMPTSNDGDPVVIGFINEHLSAGVGEKRIFSTNEQGDQVSFYIHMKNDGSCELNGTGDNLVRYAQLDDHIQSGIDDLNAELVKIQTAIQALGGTYARQNVEIDLSSAKIEEIEVNDAT